MHERNFAEFLTLLSFLRFDLFTNPPVSALVQYYNLAIFQKTNIEDERNP